MSDRFVAAGVIGLRFAFVETRDVRVAALDRDSRQKRI